MSPKIQAISARMAATPIRMVPRPRPPAPDAQFEAVVALEPVPTQLAAPAPMTTKPTMYRRIAPMLKMTMVRLLTRTLLAAPTSARHRPAQHPSAAARAILAAHPQAHKMRDAARGTASPTPYSLPQVVPECRAYSAPS